MAWLLILGVAMLLLGLALLARGKPPTSPPLPPRRRDPGGSGVWIDDYGPSAGLQLDKFGYAVDAAGLISADDSNFDSDFEPGFEPGGGSGGGGGASDSWDDGGGDGSGGD